jgi:1,5-anhydro-D-fructose reductase (1,5-anhydro-D-mannitol-forming)
VGQSSRLFTRSADARSVGFLVAGTSQIAAQQMLPAIREQPPLPGTRDVAGAWVAALYSHNERRARDFAQRHSIIHFSDDLDALLQRPEVHCVYVASHPRHHAETVAAALQAHKHVLCEPPLALSLAEAEPLVQMAQTRSLVLALNYSWRAAGAVHAVHELLVADAIGELLGGRVRNTSYLPADRQSWRLQGQGSGVLWDRTLHDLDLLRFLLHVQVREVFAHGTQYHTPAVGSAPVAEETIGFVVLTGRRVIQLHDSFVQSHVPVLVELYGTNGSLSAVQCGPASQGTEVTLRRGDTLRPIAVPAVNPYRASMANFLAAVRGEAEPLAGGAGELHNLTAMAALERALQIGKVVTVRA